MEKVDPEMTGEGDLAATSSCSVQKSIRAIDVQIKTVYAVQPCQTYAFTLFNKVEGWKPQCVSVWNKQVFGAISA